MTVRVLTQDGLADCGAACLAMVLGHFGYRCEAAGVADAVGAGRDGLTALALVQAARGYGLEARGLGVSAEVLLGGQVALPAVAHWGGNHFVVVEVIRRDRVQLVDPARGRLRLGRDEFAAGYSGVTLEFARGTLASRRAPERTRWGRVLAADLLRRRRGLLVAAALTSIVVQVIGMALPVASGVLVDRVVPDRDRALWWAVTAVVGSAVVAHLAAGLARSAVLVRLRTAIDRDLTTVVVERLLRLPLSYFTRRGTGDVVQRIGSAGTLRELVTGSVLAAVLDTPLAIGYLAVLLWWAPPIGGGLTVFALAQMLLLAATIRPVTTAGHRELASAAAAEGRLIEAVGGIEAVKASGAEAVVTARWARSFGTAVDDAAASARLQGRLDASLQTLRVAAPVVLIAIGSLRVMSGSSSLGEMIALTGVATAALVPIGSLVGTAQRFQVAGAHLRRLGDILAATPEQDGVSVSPAPPLWGSITVRGLGFRYDPRAPWVVRGLDLYVPAGSTVALVGRSGSGKSTVARLLLGLVPASEGTVRFDGIDAATLEVRSLRGQFGVVTQDCPIFDGSIAENIALCRPEATRAEIVAAARLACLDGDVDAMPMGYETVLRDGAGLSGGQRQRLAIARAVVSEPRILLLDEATSALDAVTEAAVTANLRAAKQTRIVIAHRLGTIRDADLIVVLDGGRIVAAGQHDDLLAAGGVYAELVRGQAAEVPVA